MAGRRLFSGPAVLGLLAIVALAQLVGLGFTEAVRRRRPPYLKEVARPWIQALEAHRAATGTFPVALHDIGLEIDHDWRYRRDASGACELTWDGDLSDFHLTWSSASGWHVLRNS